MIIFLPALKSSIELSLNVCFSFGYIASILSSKEKSVFTVLLNFLFNDLFVLFIENPLTQVSNFPLFVCWNTNIVYRAKGNNKNFISELFHSKQLSNIYYKLLVNNWEVEIWKVHVFSFIFILSFFHNDFINFLI